MDIQCVANALYCSKYFNFLFSRVYLKQLCLLLEIPRYAQNDVFFLVLCNKRIFANI